MDIHSSASVAVDQSRITRIMGKEPRFLLLSVSFFNNEPLVRDHQSSNNPANIDISFRESLKVRFGARESNPCNSVIVGLGLIEDWVDSSGDIVGVDKWGDEGIPCLFESPHSKNGLPNVVVFEPLFGEGEVSSVGFCELSVGESI